MPWRKGIVCQDPDLEEWDMLPMGAQLVQVREGRAEVLVPRSPSRGSVFYNPVMKLSRDLAVAIVHGYQNMVSRELSVCDAMTGCGIRGIRYALEVEGIGQVIAADLNPIAAYLASRNVELNELQGKVQVIREEANSLLSQHARPGERFDVIDIDPFGSPAPFLDSAVRALKGGGLLALTATDMATLCGVNPKACRRRYHGLPIRTEYSREIAIRLLLSSLAMTAARHGVAIRPLFAHASNHYIRLYVSSKIGRRHADQAISELGFAVHCFKCLGRRTAEGIGDVERRCAYCGWCVRVAGPLWIGELYDRGICDLVSKYVHATGMVADRSVARLVDTILREVDGPPFYYVLDKLCDKHQLPIPKLSSVLLALRQDGYVATPTHFHRNGFRTDCPPTRLREVVASLVSK